MRQWLRQLFGGRKALSFGLYGACGCALAALGGEGLWRFAEKAGTPLKGPPIDVVFVLDVTSSMRAEMEGIKSGLQEFVSELTAQGFDAQVGLVAFSDRFLPGGEPRVLTFQGSPLTPDLIRFREELDRLRLMPGGDLPESSLDAVALASRQPFRSEAARVLLLITDAPPHVPDVEMHTIAQAAAAVRAAGIAQLHLVTTRTDRPVYQPLQAAAPGDFFALSATAAGRGEFERFLPSVSSSIARRAAEGLASAREFDPSSRTLLLFVAAEWTALLGAGLGFALLLGQNRYLRRPPLAWRSGLTAVLGGAAAGAAAGLAGQAVFAAMGPHWASALIARSSGWSIFGLLIGLGMAHLVPNLARLRAALGGLLGGALGAAVFALASRLLGETAARLLGAATLGFTIGAMLALVEILSREASLIVSWHPHEETRLSLGERPIVFGSSSRAHVYLPRDKGYPAIAATVRLHAGRVEFANLITEQTQHLGDGERLQIGPVSLQVELR